MKYTKNLNLPVYDNPYQDKFDLSDWNEANENIDETYGELKMFKDNLPYENAGAEIVDARCGEKKLGDKIRKIDNEVCLSKENIINIDSNIKEVNSQLESKANKDFVTYEDFGAKGDGVTDDYLAIYNAHEYANSNNKKIVTNSFKTYYIKDVPLPINISTNVNWGDSSFVIDDREVTLEKCNINVFNIVRNTETSVVSVSPFKKTIKFFSELEGKDGLLYVVNNNIKHFIRKGANQDEGYYQQEVIKIKQGRVVSDILWDFDNVTSAMFFPYDSKNLIIDGGNFLTLANRLPNVYGSGFDRGIYCGRSNVTIKNITHRIDYNGVLTSKPYNGWLLIHNATDIILEHLNFDAHKVYYENGVAMGNYGYVIKNSIDIIVRDFKQINSILDNSLWGISATNYVKNMQYINYKANRIDSHRGVNNLFISNSILNKLSVIGSGKMEVINTVNYGDYFINLRSDYGSTWNGDILIKNCTFSPSHLTGTDVVLLGGRNDSTWNFGYKCYYPNVEIKNLNVVVNNKTDNFAFIYNKALGATPISTVCEESYDNEVAKGRFPYITKEYFKVDKVTFSKPCNVYVFYSLPQYLYSGVVNKLIKFDTVTNSVLPVTSLCTNFTVEINNVDFPNKYNIIKDVPTGVQLNYSNYRVIPEIIFNNCNVSFDITSYPLNVVCNNSNIKKINSAYNDTIGNCVINNCILGKNAYDNQVVTFSNKALTINNSLFLLPNLNNEAITYDVIKNSYSIFSVVGEFVGGFRVMTRLQNCKFDFDTKLIITTDMATKYGIKEEFLRKYVNFDIFTRVV